MNSRKKKINNIRFLVVNDFDSPDWKLYGVNTGFQFLHNQPQKISSEILNFMSRRKSLNNKPQLHNFFYGVFGLFFPISSNMKNQNKKKIRLHVVRAFVQFRGDSLTVPIQNGTFLIATDLLLNIKKNTTTIFCLLRCGHTMAKSI